MGVNSRDNPQRAVCLLTNQIVYIIFSYQCTHVSSRWRTKKKMFDFFLCYIDGLAQDWSKYVLYLYWLRPVKIAPSHQYMVCFGFLSFTSFFRWLFLYPFHFSNVINVFFPNIIIQCHKFLFYSFFLSFIIFFLCLFVSFVFFLSFLHSFFCLLFI